MKPINHIPLWVITITLILGISIIIWVDSLPVEEQKIIKDSSPGMNLTIPQIAELRGVSVGQIWGEFLLITVLLFGFMGIFRAVNVHTLKRKTDP